MVLDYKISCIIHCYFGKRDNCHPNLIKDPLFYIKTHLQTLPETISEIDFICTFEDKINEDLINEIQHLSSNKKFTVTARENLGGSYVSWYLGLEKDNNTHDLVILLEDDYTIISLPLELLFNFKNNPDLFFLCQMWEEKPYLIDNICIPAHAAISNGIINNRIYNQAKNNNINFKLDFGSAKDKKTMFINQAQFLENYRLENYQIKDIRKEFSSLFLASQNETIEYGNPNGSIVFLPITEKYFPHD
jgi:hypothetical protein